MGVSFALFELDLVFFATSSLSELKLLSDSSEVVTGVVFVLFLCVAGDAVDAVAVFCFFALLDEVSLFLSGAVCAFFEFSFLSVSASFCVFCIVFSGAKDVCRERVCLVDIEIHDSSSKNRTKTAVNQGNTKSKTKSFSWFVGGVCWSVGLFVGGHVCFANA